VYSDNAEGIEMSEEMQAQMAGGRHNCRTVPSEVFAAIADCLYDSSGADAPRDRDALTNRVAEIMAREDWTFCSCYRHENTPAHALIYGLVSTVGANIKASYLQAQKIA
jgi:hypothetical protein